MKRYLKSASGTCIRLPPCAKSWSSKWKKRQAIKPKPKKVIKHKGNLRAGKFPLCFNLKGTLVVDGD
ncbi:hypothetical protein EFB08_19975 [Rufibacter latericius]|uniref:Uncharacterized protein n=1 Tax=Rufibacter latericius TaxID=2487040 RepID=A0A3M9M9Z8_9BACT|nr:hypothetical protein EFB08_19975 [Rufibacter latericius]